MNKYFEFEMFLGPTLEAPPERILKVGEIISETEETVTVAYLTPYAFEREVRVFKKSAGIEFNSFNKS